MKKTIKLMSLILSVICLVSCLVSCNNDKKANVIALTDNQALLTNPDMGWNFTYYANCIYAFGDELQSGDFLDAFPCETVFFRIGWNYIEPEEGKFNWDFTDKVANAWIERGKRIAFCWAVTYAGDQSTPLWVKDAGAEGVWYTWQIAETDGELHLTPKDYPNLVGTQTFNTTPRDAKEYALNQGIRNDPNYNGGNEVEEGDYEHYRGTWVPEYDDPIFLEKWENFLRAAGERYDNNPAVEFIEIGSFGDWGEGHSTCTRLNRIDSITKRKHINLYLKYFKNVQLMINDDAVGSTGDPLVDYTKENNIGISDHSVQVPASGYPEGRTGNREMANCYYNELPVLLENHNGTLFTKTYLDSVNLCHATYARINCNPYTTKRTEWADKITLRLGYRLTFTEVSFDALDTGKEIGIKFKIKNTGAAICYGGGNPTFYIVDDLGRVQATATSTFDVKDLSVANSAEKAEEKEGTAILKMPNSLIKGDYFLAVAVTKDGKDCYNLPLDHQDGNKKRYNVATFSVR